jgi:hypothetical protein
MVAMSDTPLTEDVYDDWLNDDSLLLVDGNGNNVVNYRALCEKMIFHAAQMERDRARLLKALRWYARASNRALHADDGFMARKAVAEVEVEGENEK